MRWVFFVLLAIGLCGAVGYYAVDNLYFSRFFQKKAVLAVNTPFADAGVFLDGTYLGPTPYFGDSLEPGERELRVGSWVGKISLSAGALTAVNQDGGPEPFSGGDVLWLEPVSRREVGMVVVSTPDKATVKLDGKEAGEAPLRVETIEPGDHTLTLEREGYVSRDIRVRIQQGYILHVTSDLMVNPLPPTVETISLPYGKLSILNYMTAREELLVDSAEWLKGLIFYYRSYGFSASPKPEIFVQEDGKVFGADGTSLPPEQYPRVRETDPLVVGYVGKTAEKPGDAALAVFAQLEAGEATPSAGAAPTQPQVEVLQTGTGWLRVRSGPGLGNPEIAKLDVGATATFLEESNGWTKLKLSDGKEGWVSSQFVQKR